MKPIWIVLFALVVAGCAPDRAPDAKPTETPAKESPVASQPDGVKEDSAKTAAAKMTGNTPAPKSDNEIVLFDGVSLKNWKLTNFGGEGEVSVEKGMIVLDRGTPLTGVTWTGPELPRTNYEVTLEAQLLTGIDFFCGIGFPVGKSNTSFVAGGWGGNTCGISLIDGIAADNNETSTVQNFKEKQWYRFRLRVTPEKIEVWLDDKQIVDVKIKGRNITIHPRMAESLPFGLTSFDTVAAYRNVKLRKL